MKAKELRELSVEELELKNLEERRQLFNLLNEFKMTKKSEQAHRIPLLRRNIARVLTVLNEKRVQSQMSMV